MSEITTRNENAVGYVDDWRWISGITFLVVAILVSTSKRVEEVYDDVAIEYTVLGLLCILAIMVSYPYLHYRLNGGEFQRIPPRYHHEKAFMPVSSSKGTVSPQLVSP